MFYRSELINIRMPLAHLDLTLMYYSFLVKEGFKNTFAEVIDASSFPNTILTSLDLRLFSRQLIRFGCSML